MNQANVKVSFYLKKSEADANGECPVMAKLNIGKYSEAAFSVKMKVPQSRWTSGRASGKSVAAKEINNRLDEIRAVALSIYNEQSAVRDGVTAEEVKSILKSGLESTAQPKVCRHTAMPIGTLRSFCKKIQADGYSFLGIGPLLHRQIRPVPSYRTQSRSRNRHQPDRPTENHRG